ncbi:MAG: AbrB/MazE/SpoVT family DNA-binding domain-containing protein [Methanobacteriota archaeon]|nr:MAG: AbrB/MazE/SpoVT family DNA-binding domain-containing protein [Euryarchaeota archaeon]
MPRSALSRPRHLPRTRCVPSRRRQTTRGCVDSGLGGQPSHRALARTRGGGLKSKEILFLPVESYISKVTSAGQLTLPKRIRKALGLEESEYVEVALLGGAAVIRRLREDDAVLEAIRRKVKKSGLSRASLEAPLGAAARKAWKKRYREAVR